MNDLAAANRGSSLGIIHPGGAGGAFPIPPQNVFFAPPFKIATGDLDGDGDTDIAATTDTGTGGDIQVLLNDGTGTMVDGPTIASGGSPSSIDAADFDSDGDNDLVCSCSASASMTRVRRSATVTGRSARRGDLRTAQRHRRGHR